MDWNNSATFRKIEAEYGIEFSKVKSELEERLPLVQIGLRARTGVGEEERGHEALRCDRLLL